MAGRELLLLGGWTRLYRKARTCGLTVTCIHDRSQIRSDDWELVDRWITLPLDAPEIPDIASIIHARTPFGCVLSLQELGLINAALVGERLAITGNPMRPVELTRNKIKMRNHMRTQGLRCLPYRVVSTPDEAADFMNQLGRPIILKPIFGSGSRQIHKITAKAQLSSALDEIRCAFLTSEVLAEMYLDGREISVEAFSWEGKHTVVAMTDKLTTGEPFFVEIGHSVPATLDSETAETVRNMTVEFLTSIGHQLGPSHTEVMVTLEGPYIIESHTRAGGDFINDLVDLVYGVDLHLLTLRGLAGEIPTIDVRPPRGGAAIRYLKLPTGTVTKVEGVEAARAIHGTVRCDVQLRVGQRVEQFRDSSGRYGCLLAHGASVEDAVAIIDAATKELVIEVERDA